MQHHGDEDMPMTKKPRLDQSPDEGGGDGCSIGGERMDAWNPPALSMAERERVLEFVGLATTRDEFALGVASMVRQADAGAKFKLWAVSKAPGLGSGIFVVPTVMLDLVPEAMRSLERPAKGTTSPDAVVRLTMGFDTADEIDVLEVLQGLAHVDAGVWMDWVTKLFPHVAVEGLGCAETGSHLAPDVEIEVDAGEWMKNCVGIVSATDSCYN